MCSSCAAGDEQVPGVSDLGVSFATGRANVDYDATGRDEFEEAASKVGYSLQATSRRRVHLLPAENPPTRR